MSTKWGDYHYEVMERVMRRKRRTQKEGGGAPWIRFRNMARKSEASDLWEQLGAAVAHKGPIGDGHAFAYRRSPDGTLEKIDSLHPNVRQKFDDSELENPPYPASIWRVERLKPIAADRLPFKSIITLAETMGMPQAVIQGHEELVREAVRGALQDQQKFDPRRRIEQGAAQALAKIDEINIRMQQGQPHPPQPQRAQETTTYTKGDVIKVVKDFWGDNAKAGKQKLLIDDHGEIVAVDDDGDIQVQMNPGTKAGQSKFPKQWIKRQNWIHIELSMQVDKEQGAALIFAGDELRKLLPHYHPDHLPNVQKQQGAEGDPWAAPAQVPTEREKRPQQLGKAPNTAQTSPAGQEQAKTTGVNSYCQALQMQEYQNTLARTLQARIEAEQQAVRLASQAKLALEAATKIAEDKQLAMAQEIAEQTERQQELNKQALAAAVKAQQQAAADARAAELKAAQEQACKLAMEQLAARAADENQKGWERRQLVLQENHTAWIRMGAHIVQTLEQHQR
jgi:hypothetical protein